MSSNSGLLPASGSELPTAAEPATIGALTDENGPRRLFAPGDLVAGRYRIVRFIARGGMGEVYAARDRELDHQVALKAVRPEVAVHAQTLDRFRREINLSRKVTHHNVCRIYDAGTHHDQSLGLSIRFLTMELLEGETLTRYLRREGPLTPERALPIVVQVASGLAAAHTAGVVHRDFKTSNVLLSETPRGLRAVITDFGLSQTLDENGKTPIDSDKLTGTGQLMGTLAYLAPEQLEGRQSSAATDLYALGVVLYQMLTGRLPFDGGSPLMAALKRLHEDPPQPTDHVADLDPTWSEVTMRCLNRDPEHRFQRADELLGALGVEVLTDSSTTIQRPVLDASELGSTQVEVPVVQERGVPIWKAVALAAAVGIAVWATTWLLPFWRDVSTLQVLVTEPVVRGAGDSSLIVSSFESALLRGLSSLEGVRPLDPSVVGDDDAPPDDLRARVGADEVLRLEAGARGREWLVEIRRIGPGGEVLWAEDLRVLQDDPRLQADALQAAIRRAYPKRDVLEGLGQLEISSEDYAEFLRLAYAVDNAPEDVDWFDILADLERIRQRSLGFTELYWYCASVAGALYLNSHEERYLDWAFERLDEAKHIAPDDPRPIEKEIDLAIRSGRLERAEKAIQELKLITPAGIEVPIAEARLARALGRLDEAISGFQDAAEIRPAPRLLYDLADTRMQAGRIEEARATLDLLITSWPTYYFGKEKLAELELIWGDLELSKSIYSELLVREHPEPVVLNNLGTIFLLERDYAAALPLFKQLADRFPGQPDILIGYADCENLSGNTEAAESIYQRLLELTDPKGAQKWTDWIVRAQASAHLGKDEEARTSVERSLESCQSSNYFCHLWASLVFVVLDDQTEALLQAEKARELGAPERWFTLPWLDELPATGANGA